MKIPSLRNHTIVCGTDPTAVAIIEELQAMKVKAAGQGESADAPPGSDYIVCDSSGDSIEKLAERIGPFNYLVGDVTDDEVLGRAHIESAFGIFCVLPIEKDNVCVALAARQKNPSIRIVTTTADPFVYGQKLSRAGANAVVSPNFIGGLRIVSEAARPNVTAFLDEMLRDKNPDLQIHEIEIAAGSSLCNTSLMASRIPAATGLLVIALLRKGDVHYMYNPPASTVIGAGDTIVVMGGRQQVESLTRLAGRAQA